ncbi:SRPBCC family protein [Maribacter sp. CXY002]|uniref:SRPBCC family protein n=1 Tax=Maribacter luteocoastalis TaxID=3407671 RepID=UPI003B680396
MTTLLYVLATIVLLIVFLAIIAPKTYDVSRAIEIDTSNERIFPYLKYLEKQREWSPWAKKDPDMETKLIGTDGAVGAVSYWNGNKAVGEGEQELTKIMEGKRVESELRFLKPWKSESDCYIDLEEITQGKNKVTWGFTGKNKFPFTIMMLFMNMDKMIGKDFEEGLEMLKAKLES